ncbi:hypothetical protein G6F57_000794 [Rhizopus arrhizus]|nr:hypothetical protein G6F66_001985 [Rhizopus arrhizus]KAG1485641.1 hypothetical protein G6F57_000794 [Rhizopus arrhizus]
MEIINQLENTLPYQFQENFRNFKREGIKLQTRFQVNTAAELYEQLDYLKNHHNEIEPEEAYAILQRSSEQAKRLADFGHATAKAQDQEARDYALKTLRLPPSLKHLKSQFENNKKTNAFDTEFIEQLHKLDSNRDFCKEQCVEEETILHQEALGETNEEVSEDHMEEDHFWRTVKGRKPQQPIQRQQNTKYQQLPQRNKPAITCSPILSQKQSINIQHPFPIQLPKPFLNEHTSNYSVPNDGIVPGGRLTRFLESWKQTILHPWPVSVLQHGYKLQFAKTPVPWRSVPMKMSTTDKLAVNEAISKFLEAGIVERSPIQDKGFLSNFFTIQEAKKRGPILNCQKLNQFLQYEHFKMEEVPALREILEKNDYMYKIDLKDASSLSISIPSIWAKYSSPDLQQAYEVRYRTSTQGGYTTGLLPGRFMYSVEEQRRYAEDYLTSIESSTIFGIYHKYTEKFPDTQSITGIPRFQLQFQEDVNFGTATEDHEITSKNQTSSTNPDNMLMQMGCKSIGQNGGHGSGNRGSVTPHPLLTKRPTENSATLEVVVEPTSIMLGTKDNLYFLGVQSEPGWCAV